MIQVILADDHNILRHGLRVLLERTNDIRVIGEADNGQRTLELASSLNPDVIVLDITMPRLNGLDTAQRLREMQCPARLVMLSMHSDLILVREALRLGACGYLLKSSVFEELVLAIRAASRGETYLTPAVSRALWEQVADTVSSTNPFALLTTREREVLQLIGEGYTNQAIACMLCLSVKTVEKHRASVMAKLGVRDNAGLIRVAIKHGLIPLGT